MSSVRFRRCSRRFAWLALAAMLSLATLPTFGRLASVAGHHDPVAMAGHAMSPAMHDMAMPDMAMATSHHMHGAAANAPSSVPHGEHGGHDGHQGHDCVYCLLLSGLTAATALHWIPPASPVVRSQPAPAFTNRHIDAPVPALGGQGPPSIAMG